MIIEQLLEQVVKQGASDGFVSAGAPPSIKVDGELRPIGDKPLSDDHERELVLSNMREDKQKDILEHQECN